MENQHRKITGYRELNEADIASMNAVKEMGKRLSDLITQLEPVLDPRWQAIATTHLQQGLMALTRAIAKPDFF
jgi:hypothetical protein